MPYNQIDTIGTITKLGCQERFVTLPIITKETWHWPAISKEAPLEIVQRANAGLKAMEQSVELRDIYIKYVQ